MRDERRRFQSIIENFGKIKVQVESISRQPKYKDALQTLDPSTKQPLMVKDRNWCYITSVENLERATSEGVVVECRIYKAAELITDNLSRLSTDEEIRASFEAQRAFYDESDRAERIAGNGRYKNSAPALDIREATKKSPAFKDASRKDEKELVTK